MIDMFCKMDLMRFTFLILSETLIDRERVINQTLVFCELWPHFPPGACMRAEEAVMRFLMDSQDTETNRVQQHTALKPQSWLFYPTQPLSNL